MLREAFARRGEWGCTEDVVAELLGYGAAPGWDAVEEDEKSDGGAVALAQLLSNLVGEQAAG
jgi:hypothetical protein